MHIQCICDIKIAQRSVVQGQWFRVQASDFKLDTEELPVQGVDDHIDLWVNGQGLNYLLHAHVKYVLLDQYL